MNQNNFLSQNIPYFAEEGKFTQIYKIMGMEEDKNYHSSYESQ